MTSEALESLLLRLDILQDASRTISAELRQGMRGTAAPVSAKTRGQLCAASSRLGKARDWVVEAMAVVQQMLHADALARESQTLAHESVHAMPPVAEFCGPFESVTEG